MGCTDCSTNCKWNVTHTCRVCELVNSDTSQKTVCHCTVCGAYICKDHWKDYAARGEAAFKELIDKAGNIVSDVVEKVSEIGLATKARLNRISKRKKKNETETSS